MKNIKYVVWAIAAALSAVACTKEINDEQPSAGQRPEGEKITINAVSESLDGSATDTKAVGVYGYQVLWENNDRIAVTDGIHHGQFELIEGAGTTVGKFSQAEDDDQTYNTEITGYYPASLVQKDGSLIWPSHQTWSEAMAGIPMTASASLEDKKATFNFKNLGGVLQLVLTSPQGEVDLKSITISAGNAGISGPFSVNNGVAEGFTSGTTITLDCSGFTIGPAAKTVNIAIPANVYKDVQLRFETLDNEVRTLTSSELELSRGVVSKVTLPLGNFERSFPNYLSFTAIGCDIPLGMKKGAINPYTPDNIKLKYTFDPASGSWEDFTADAASDGVQSITEIPQGKTVFLRAAEEISAFGKSFAWWTFDFGDDTADNGGRIVAGGSIMSLLSPDVESTTAGDYAFYKLFSDAKVLTVAPSMPAVSVGKYSYEYMYSSCTNLKEAPELPATELSIYCYESMFEGCSSLGKGPEVLPATILANNCYNNMFKGCTSLTEAPVLPATDLSDECYRSMFSGCKKLVNAPHLPAKTLVYGCYAEMFYNCSSLKTISVGFSEWQGSVCRNSWIANVPSGGTFFCPADLLAIWGEDHETGNFIPSGWTVYRNSIPDSFATGSVFIDGIEAMYIGNDSGKKIAIMTANLGSEEDNILGTAFSADDLQELQNSDLWKNGWRLPEKKDMEYLNSIPHSEVGNGTSWNINDNTLFIPYNKQIGENWESRLWLSDGQNYYFFHSSGNHGEVPATKVDNPSFYVRLVKKF